MPRSVLVAFGLLGMVTLSLPACRSSLRAGGDVVTVSSEVSGSRGEMTRDESASPENASERSTVGSQSESIGGAMRSKMAPGDITTYRIPGTDVSFEMVAAPEPCQRRPRGRPQPTLREQTGELVEVEVHHEQSVGKRVIYRCRSRVPNLPFVNAAVHRQGSVRNVRRH